MMRDARYAQKRHTSYLQAHTDAIILFLLKNKRNRLILTQIVNKNKPMKGLQICLLISSKIFRDSCLFNFILHAILHLSF